MTAAGTRCSGAVCGSGAAHAAAASRGARANARVPRQACGETARRRGGARRAGGRQGPARRRGQQPVLLRGHPGDAAPLRDVRGLLRRDLHRLRRDALHRPGAGAAAGQGARALPGVRAPPASRWLPRRRGARLRAAPVPGPCGRCGRGGATRAALSALRLSAHSCAGRLRARVPGPVRRVHRRRQGARPRRCPWPAGARAASAPVRVSQETPARAAAPRSTQRGRLGGVPEGRGARRSSPTPASSA